MKHWMTVLAMAAMIGSTIGCSPQLGEETPSRPTPAGKGMGAESLMQRAMRIHREAPLVDGHNDLPWQLRSKAASDLARMDFRGPLPMLHTDVPRLRKGGVGGIFFAAYVPYSAAERGIAARMTLEILARSLSTANDV